MLAIIIFDIIAYMGVNSVVPSITHLLNIAGKNMPVIGNANNKIYLIAWAIVSHTIGPLEVPLPITFSNGNKSDIKIKIIPGPKQSRNPHNKVYCFSVAEIDKKIIKEVRAIKQ